MPSFLIVHCASQDGRLDEYRQPPTLDVGGLRVPLDWGDITLHVPAGDLPVTVFVTRTSGQVEGAMITVRAPAGTGTRLTFVPPLQPGGASHLRIDGQWPADSSMHYYAARDARTLTAPAASSVPTPHVGGGRQLAQAGLRVMSPGAPPPVAPTPPVGPTPGSTASVPPQPSSFGHRQGALVDPVVASPGSPAQPQPRRDPGHQPQPSSGPSFGQRPQPAVELDVYGRPLVAGDRQPPPIPTPEEFDRLEREAQQAQARAYEAWVEQQRAQAAVQAAAQGAAMPHPGPSPDDGAPEPVGILPGASAGQAPPGWYPDPYRRADARWFDGRQWSSSVMRQGVRGHDLPG
ncbi:MAG: DUF2510 domain-containing protein [Agrococcus sp.]